MPFGFLKGSGNNDVATRANKLTNKRTFKVNLASNEDVAFDGTENATLGVEGILPVEQGGTGYSSVDNVPTKDSEKLVKSGGVYTELTNKAGTATATSSANGLMSYTDKIKIDHFSFSSTWPSYASSGESVYYKGLSANTVYVVKIRKGTAVNPSYTGVIAVAELALCDLLSIPFINTEGEIDLIVIRLFGTGSWKLLLNNTTTTEYSASFIKLCSLM